MSSSPLAGVTDTVADVWSKNAGAVHDFASSAAGFATDVATAAVGQLEELPERVVGFAAAAKDRVVPPPRRSLKPWMLVVAGIAAFVALAWFLRRRRSAGPGADAWTGGRSDQVRTPADPVTSVAGT